MHVNPLHVTGTVYQTQFQDYENTTYQPFQGYGNTASLSYPDTWVRKPACLHLPYSPFVTFGTCHCVCFTWKLCPFSASVILILLLREIDDIVGRVRVTVQPLTPIWCSARCTPTSSLSVSKTWIIVSTS